MIKKCTALILALALLPAFGAFAEETARVPAFATFGEAVEAAGEDRVMGGTSEYMAVILPVDGQYCRVVCMLDDKAQELDQAAMDAEGDDRDPAYDEFNAYLMTLPVTTTELITARPLEQAELDEFVGKTIAELEEAGFFVTSSGGGDDEISFDMTNGIYEYQFAVDADYDTYEALEQNDESHTLVVKSGKYTGISRTAADIRFRADGTFVPEEEETGAGMEWLSEFAGIFEAAQNGGEADMEGLIRSISEKYPEAAESLGRILEMLGVENPEAAAPDGAE